MTAPGRFSRFLGTMTGIFQFAPDGPMLRRNAAAIEAKDSSDSALADVHLSGVGNPAGQTNYLGAARTKRTNVTFAALSLYTCVVTDYLLTVTNTTNAGDVQLIALGSTVDEASWILVKDKSGGAAAHNITVKCPAGKNFDGALNGTAVIATNGGRWTGFEDENGDWWTMGLV